MQSSDLVNRKAYAWCESPRSVAPELAKVKYLGLARSGKARVRWLEGELLDLEEWVATRQIVCSWAERKAYLRDRQRQAIQDADSNELIDRIVENAISHVLTATGEEGGFSRTWALTLAKADRLWTRAGLDNDPRQEPFAYVDRFGTLHLGYRSALRFARAFAAAEPDACVLYVQGWERQLEAQGHLPGGRWQHGFLREERPAHALVRQWAGEGEVATLKKEIQRLQSLVNRGVSWLREAGDERHASALDRGLHGR